jgi:uncharacterized protein (TIGR02421 family)
VLPAATATADRQLTALAQRIELLLDVSPTDDEAQRTWWLGSDRRRDPRFSYRPPSVDPDRYRAELDEVDLAEVEEPALLRLLAGKVEELHGYAELVAHRGTPAFLEVSGRLYGTADDELLELSLSLLDRLPPEQPTVEPVGPEEFAARASEEVEAYRRRWPDFQATVSVRPDVPSLMVVQRDLFVGTDSWIPRHRVEALVHHEVGTHLVTAETGGRQPLRLLEQGLAHYEETQEALAVLAEHLIGGLDAARLRTLAARALAARRVCDGAGFGDVFAELVGLGFTEAAAWPITMRMLRGGGFTKDVIYLRGLVALVEHLEGGGALEPLLVGKLHLSQVPDIVELLARGMLEPPALHPRWLEVDGAEARLNEIRAGHAPVSAWLHEPAPGPRR